MSRSNSILVEWRRRVWAVLLLTALAAGGGTANVTSAQPFELRTYVAGLGGVTGTNGVAVADYNRDGHLDVYFVVPEAYDADDTWTWNRLFAGLGGGAFIDETRRANARGNASGVLENTSEQGAKQGAAWADYDNDGWPDLYLTNAGSNQLLRNRGDGTFEDVTEQAGVAGGATQMSTSALWFDYDLDGDLDLHVGVWTDFAEEDQARDMVNPLYENLSDGTFRPVPPAESGLSDGGKTYTTLPLDVNGDGFIDLYDANDFGRNRLYVNTGDGTFREATEAYGLEDRWHGMGLALGDPNGDGRFDIFVTNISNSGDERHSLFVASGDSGYVNRAVEAEVAQAGWGWGTEFFDMENDGDEDLFVGAGYFDPLGANNPNALFENVSAGETLRFTEVGYSLGVADEEAARGVVVFDYDDDGDLDLLVANHSEPPFLYRNALSRGAWLKVRLEGTSSNRDARGAVVEVWAQGQRWVRSHHGAQFLGQNLLPVHVGLGAAERADSVIVRWPGGLIERASSVAVDQTLRFVEGQGLVDGRLVSNEASGVGHARSLRLYGSAPNPTRGRTTIRFDLQAPARVELRLFDVWGRTVRVLQQVLPGGPHTFVWDGRDAAGAPVPSGVYVYRLSLEGVPSDAAAGCIVVL